VSGNTRGVWVKGTSSATTATFRAAIKVTLVSATPAKFNACAYATDYPPNIASVSGSTYTLKGTQSFQINGTPVSGNKYTGSVSSLTDPTGCPGCIAVRDFQLTSSNVNIPCCPNLTAVGGYCRNLAADDAYTIASCTNNINGLTLEVKNNNMAEGSWSCPSGWRMIRSAEIICLCKAGKIEYHTVAADYNNVPTACDGYDYAMLGCGLTTSCNGTCSYARCQLYAFKSATARHYSTRCVR
jgi:hypothetical protein